MRILVIGAGAVSGYFGARLVQHGRDVTFLVRAPRAEQLRRDGLRIAGERGEFAVEPKLLTAAELATSPERFDLVLLGVKAYSLAGAVADFAPAVGPGTAILPLLNGMAHLEVLRARFGAGAVLGGLTRIVADLDAEGRIVLMEKLHDLTFGELDAQVTERITRIDDALSGCEFDAELSSDILASMWLKWALLSSIGAITLLGRGTVGEINRVPGGRDLALGVAHEAMAIAAANGYRLDPADVAMIEKRLTREESILVSSLYRDLHKGAPVEADHILGDLLHRAALQHVPAPLLQAAYTQTKVYESRRGT